MNAPNEQSPERVSGGNGSKQSGEAYPVEWGWVEHSVWTERMLEALRNGVKGGVWFSLIDKDHQRWPNAFFRAHGLFSLADAHRALLQSPGG
jgi:hypothetical protein